MALFDFIRRKNHRTERPAEANTLLRTSYCGFYYARKRYSDAYLWLVVNKIFAGLRSVNLYNASTLPDKTVDALCGFVMSNAEALVWQYYDKGFMVLDVTNTAAPRLVYDVRFAEDGHIEVPRSCRYSIVYSPEYSVQRLSAFRILRNEFESIDTLRSADRYLTESLGALGIISGREMPMTAREKNDFLEEVKTKMGITPDKFQFLVATGQVAYTPITIPVADLNLQGKINDTLKLISDYLGVPYDLISYSGQSTYANMQQAVKLFYTNCIAPLAEQLLLLIRHAIRQDTKLLVLSENVTFKLDNTDLAQLEQQAQLKTYNDILAIIKQATDNGLAVDDLRQTTTDNLNKIQL